MPKPTTYDPEYVGIVDQYLAQCQDKHTRTLISSNKGRRAYSYRFTVQLPSKEDFAEFIGVSRKTLYNWADENDEFADALERIDNEQKKRLINSGLEGTYNPTIAKLMLSSNHGMRERVDNTTNDQPLNEITNEQIDRIADRIAARKASDGRTSS